jgi:hypothetical protein
MRKLVVVLLALMVVSWALDADARRRRRRRRRRARHGYLQVNSTTTGAKVIIDGALIGRIPLDRKIKVRAGKHTVKIVKRGFTQYLDVVRVRRRRTKVVDIDLLPVSAALVVTSSAKNARVFVDGKFVGLTPVDTDIQPGKHSLRVQRAGFHDFIKPIKAIAGQKVTVLARLDEMAVGTTPYRPAPPPPPKWYEKWYVWAGAAGALVAVAVGIIVPVALSSGSDVADFNADHAFKTSSNR